MEKEKIVPIQFQTLCHSLLHGIPLQVFGNADTLGNHKRQLKINLTKFLIIRFLDNHILLVVRYWHFPDSSSHSA